MENGAWQNRLEKYFARMERERRQIIDPLLGAPGNPPAITSSDNSVRVPPLLAGDLESEWGEPALRPKFLGGRVTKKKINDTRTSIHDRVLAICLAIAVIGTGAYCIHQQSEFNKKFERANNEMERLAQEKWRLEHELRKTIQASQLIEEDRNLLRDILSEAANNRTPEATKEYERPRPGDQRVIPGWPDASLPAEGCARDPR